MELSILLLQQNIVMALYMLIGYMLFKRKIVSVSGSLEIGSVSLRAILPITIVNAFMQEFTAENMETFAVSAVLGCASVIIALLVSKIAFGKKYMIENFSTSFANAGFIGIPIIQMVLGDIGVFYISCLMGCINIAQWTYGVFLMTEDKKEMALSKSIKNPVILSVFLGAAVFVLQIQPPTLVATTMKTLANMNGPLAMIVLGTYLAQVPLKEIFSGKLNYCCSAVRLIIIPVVTIFVFALVPDKYELVTTAVLIGSATPIGSNVAIFAQMYNQNYGQAVKNVCLSAILCIVTMPIVILIATYVWQL